MNSPELNRGNIKKNNRVLLRAKIGFHGDLKSVNYNKTTIYMSVLMVQHTMIFLYYSSLLVFLCIFFAIMVGTFYFF